MSAAEQNLVAAISDLKRAYTSHAISSDKVSTAIRAFTGKSPLQSSSWKKPVHSKPKKCIAPRPEAVDADEIDQLASSPDARPDLSTSTLKKKKKSSKKQKKKKHPDAPKKPASGYLRYRSSVYNETKRQFPDSTAQDLTKKIASLWSALSDAEKAPFNEEWKRAQAKWIRANQLFNARLAASASGVAGGGHGGVEQGGDDDGDEGENETANGKDALVVDPYDVMIRAQKKKEAKAKRTVVSREYTSEEDEGDNGPGVGEGGQSSALSEDLEVGVQDHEYEALYF